MISDRPYRPAMSHADAIAELRRHAGTQFDPELVALFCDLFASAPPAPDPSVVAMTRRHGSRERRAAAPDGNQAARRLAPSIITPASSGTLAADNGVRVDLGSSPSPASSRTPRPAPDGKGRVAG